MASAFKEAGIIGDCVETVKTGGVDYRNTSTSYRRMGARKTLEQAVKQGERAVQNFMIYISVLRVERLQAFQFD